MSLLVEAAPADEAWDRFARSPAAIAHADFVEPLFDGALDREAAIRLVRHPRFSARASRLIERRLALGPAERPLTAADRALALSSAERLEALSVQAGAICWARAIVREIRAERVAVLKEAIGEDAYTAALAHRSAALDDEVRSLAATDAGPEALGAAIVQDGRACLTAWLGTQSEGVAARVRLRFPEGHEHVEPDEAVRAAGPGILRLVAS